jgi:hypothetical protein
MMDRGDCRRASHLASHCALSGFLTKLDDYYDGADGSGVPRRGVYARIAEDEPASTWVTARKTLALC